MHGRRPHERFRCLERRRAKGKCFRRKNMTKKLISIFVAVMMVLSIIPAAVFANEGARLPSPATEKSSTATEKVVASWDFEVDPTENGWQFSDEDGDGHNWSWTTENFHSSSHSIMSESYGVGAYYPDNWAISPAFAVPESGAEVTLFVKNFSATYPENYGVYVITSDTGANEIAVGQAASGSNWNEKVYDISAFAGMSVSFAIRHYSVSGMWKFYIDDITVTAPHEPNVIYEADVSGFPVRIIENTTPADYTDALVIPEGAEYELVRTDILNEQGTPLASDAELMVGETYLLVAELAAADGKTFDPNAELTVNEGAVEVDSMFTYPDGTSAYIAVRYVCAREAVVGFYFESDPAEEGWQFVDADGDNKNWYWLCRGNNYNADSSWAFEGEGLISSASYYSAALTPDNWAISPEFEVPTSEGAIGMYICAQDPGYSDEHFAIYIGTGTEVDSYTMISEELVAEPSYAYYEFDLSEYAGETISIAIRHYNCTDQFRINLDCVEVLGTNEEPAPEPTVIDTIEIEGFVEPAWGEAPFFDVTVPEGANYTIDHTAWNRWEVESGDSDTMEPSDTFDNEAYVYYQYFEIVPNEGCVFAESVTVTINGDTAFLANSGVSESMDYFWVYTIDFTVEAPNQGIIGDTDGDGEVTTADALLALRYIMELEKIDEAQLALADVDGDGEVTMSDCLLIQRYAIGVIESFPVENP